MKAFLRPALAAGIALASFGPLVAAPASAQVMKSIGVVSPGAVLSGSSAFKTAETQRPVTYKQYYDQAKTRNDQNEAQLKPLVDKVNADGQLPNADRAALQQQIAAIQQIDQQSQRELSQILAPVVFSQEFVKEQIEEVLPKALEAAAAKKGVTMILNSSSGGILYRDKSYNMNQDVITELDTLLPVAQLSPPPGWLPRELREQQAAQGGAPAQGAAAPAAAPATAAGPQPETR